MNIREKGIGAIKKNKGPAFAAGPLEIRFAPLGRIPAARALFRRTPRS